MSSKRKQVQEKPVDEWTVEDWEKAYNQLNAKYQKLRDLMRRAIQTLSVAI